MQSGKRFVWLIASIGRRQDVGKTFQSNKSIVCAIIVCLQPVCAINKEKKELLGGRGKERGKDKTGDR